jgi:hypothetical protein
MFPDRVGRLVVDGVVDTEDYYQGTLLLLCMINKLIPA